jgi:hypothetical protein
MFLFWLTCDGLASFWCEMLIAPVSGAMNAPYCTMERSQP